MRHLIITAAAVLIALLPDVAHAAPAQPTSITVESGHVTVACNVLATGDLLLVFRYNIAYASLPTDTAAVNFLGNLKSSGGASIGTNTPYPYVSADGSYDNKGYGYGVISVYLTQAQTEAQGYTDDAGVYATWPLSGLTVSLQGNPAIFATMPINTYTLTSSDYTDASGGACDTATSNQAALGTFVIAQGSGLQSLWGVQLLTEASKLLNAADGIPYFTSAIPGLRGMVTNIYSISTESPLVPTPAPTPGGRGTFGKEARDRFDSTFYLTPALNSLGTDIGLPNGSLQSLLVFVGMVGLMFIGYRMFGAGGALIGFAGGIAIIVPLSLWAGWLSAQFGFAALGLFGIAFLTKFARDYWA